MLIFLGLGLVFFLSQRFDFVFISIFSFDFEVLYEFSPRGVQKSSEIKWVTVNRHPSPSKALGKYSRTLQEIGEKENMNDLLLKDPSGFRAGEIHKHIPVWKRILENNPSKEQI